MQDPLADFSQHEFPFSAKELSAFLETHVFPLEGLLSAGRHDELAAGIAQVRQDVKARGAWAPMAPRDVGGLGLPLTTQAHLGAILGRSPLGHHAFGAQAPDAANIELLHAFGTPAQKEQYLRGLVAGELRSCFAMTEPGHAGSNPTEMSTIARRDGDGWVLDGSKWFATSAHGADFCVVMAVTNPTGPVYGRASLFIVPCGTPGFRHVRRVSVMGDEGAGYASHSELAFEGCRVSAEHRLGPEGGGFLLAQARLGPGRVHHCMRWVGVAERCYDIMCARLVSRDIGGGKPLASRQLAQAWVAESRVDIDTSRLLVLDAVRQIEAHGTEGARVPIAAIKLHVARALDRVMDRAVQALGALGMTDDTILAYLYRHERAARIYDGPDEVHMTTIARHELRRFGGAK
ncbi:MAG: acyl-CoA dehydrogenase family protein [Sandaracinaceae bacterium]|jgi:acyl-CoA dehydrogenase|nr:acyl-CoA dehydrogenase family protein [Sandaracinaceae bacterium]